MPQILKTTKHISGVFEVSLSAVQLLVVSGAVSKVECIKCSLLN